MKPNIYIGTDRRNPKRCIVLGWQFGPVLYCIGAKLEEALSEFDERHGTRVEPGDPDLADYANGIEGALNEGEVRVTDGGTVVWVDHYEWIEEFPTYREAVKAFPNR